MLRAAAAVCPLCELRALLPARAAPWQQTRAYASQKRTPPRMELSRQVGRPAAARPKRSSGDPFSNLNQTRAPFSPPGRPERRPRSANTSTRTRDEPRDALSGFSAGRTKSGRPNNTSTRTRDEPRDALSGFSEGRAKSTKPRDGPRDDLSGSSEGRAKPGRAKSGGSNAGKKTPWEGRGNARKRVSEERQKSDQSGSGDASRTSKHWSKGTFHALKMQQSLGEVSYGRRTSVKESIAQIESFNDFPLLPAILESINTEGLPRVGSETTPVPTPAQRVAIPALLGATKNTRASRRSNKEQSAGMEQFLLAAETGSGKTLAYLLPVVDAFKRAEIAQKEEEQQSKGEKQRKNMFELDAPPLDSESDAGRPKAIVLVPTAELVAQVGATAKALSHTVKYRTALISAGFSGVTIRNRLFEPKGIDLLICTPHLLNSIAESEPNVLSRVTHLVIDEADSLFDRSFAPITSSIIDKATPSLRQIVLCSATIPRSLDRYLQNRFPEMKRLVTPNLHAIPRRVQLGVVEASGPPYNGDKKIACADTIYSIGKSVQEHNDDGVDAQNTKRVMVFVNEREQAVELADYLRTKGIDATALNRDTMHERVGASFLASFTGLDEKAFKLGKDSKEGNGNKDVKETPVSPSKRKLDNTKVVVTTDLGSRGIDTVNVRHVILFDVPHSTIDFIHRLGRAGRMGRRGRAIVLVGKGDRRDIVKEVREGMYAGQALI